MRSPEEILARIDEVKAGDMFGWQREVLINSLPFEQAKPFLKEGVVEDEWNFDALTTDEAVQNELAEYLDFAWGKARDHRGISAERSVQKLTEYAWLLERDDVVEKIEAAPYPMYGAPKLGVIAEAFELSIPAADVITRMRHGTICRPDVCDEGCML